MRQMKKLLLLPTAFAFASLAHAQGGKISVGRNVLVSGASGWEHAEYTADADPFSPGRIMVCSMRTSPKRNQLASVIYTSEDGGNSWAMALEDTEPAARFGGVWDPACAY